jgi:hypothetical protein
MQRLKAAGLFLVTGGIIILFMSIVLPTIKLTQTLVKNGPSITFDEVITYWIDTWSLPPIDAGTQFSVDMKAKSPGGLSIVILPSKNGEVIPGSTALLIHVFEPTQQTLLVSTTAPMSSEYIVTITCLRNYYTLTINSQWSPFYGLRVLLYLGLLTLPAGLLIIHYTRIKDRQSLQSTKG